MHDIINKIKEKFAREKISVGLDIGKQTINAVKLKIALGKTELLNFESQPVSLGVDKALKDIKNSLGLDIVNIGLSGAATVIRYVNFPSMKPDEFKQALKFEAKKHIPLPIAEVNFDGYILKDGLPDNKMLVLIAAAKKDIINERVKLIGEIGLKLNIIDIDSLALANAFTFNYSDEPMLKDKSIAMLNIGPSLLNLNILENGILHFSRDIHFEWHNLSSTIADISPSPAAAQAAIVETVTPVLTRLVDEVKPSFDYYESQKGSSVAKIFLSGEIEHAAGLEKKLSESFGITVELWDPLRKIEIAKAVNTDKLKILTSQLGVAMGLGLRQ